MPSNSLTDLLRLAAGSWKERSGIAVHPATSSGVIPKVVRLVIAWQQLQNSPPRFGSSSEALGAGGLSSLECPWLVIFLRPEIPTAQEEKSPQQRWALGSGLHGLLIHLKQALAPFSLDFAQTLLCFSSKVEVFRVPGSAPLSGPHLLEEKDFWDSRPFAGSCPPGASKAGQLQWPWP